MKQVERQVAAALESQLSRIPVIHLENMETAVDWRAHSLEGMHRPDIVAHVIADGTPVDIVCEVKVRGYPVVIQIVPQMENLVEEALQDVPHRVEMH